MPIKVAISLACASGKTLSWKIQEGEKGTLVQLVWSGKQEEWWSGKQEERWSGKQVVWHGLPTTRRRAPKTSAALDLLAHNGSSGVLHVDDPANREDPASPSVLDVLKSKHPAAQPAAPEALISDHQLPSPSFLTRLMLPPSGQLFCQPAVRPAHLVLMHTVGEGRAHRSTVLRMSYAIP